MDDSIRSRAEHLDLGMRDSRKELASASLEERLGWLEQKVRRQDQIIERLLKHYHAGSSGLPVVHLHDLI
jgi:hypothetical protein